MLKMIESTISFIVSLPSSALFQLYRFGGQKRQRILNAGVAYTVFGFWKKRVAFMLFFQKKKWLIYGFWKKKLL